MLLTVQNGRPALVQEDGSVIFHSIYTGSRYWGTMYNVLKDYDSQHWTVRETAAFNSGKDFSVLGRKVRYFVAECENSTLWAALGTKDALFRTETRNTGAEKAPVDVIALGGMYCQRIERVICNTFGEHNGLNLFDMNCRTNVKRFLENDFADSAVHLPAVDREGQAVHFGFASFDHYFSSVFACEGGTVEYRHFLDGRKLPAGRTLCSDWMQLSFYSDLTAGLPEYARLIHDFNRFPNRRTKAPTGFCSWYYYMDNIDERMVYENLAKCDEIHGRVPLEVFQIDAGWSSGNHNGEENRTCFTRGMKFYADLICEHGYTPGIWLSPFNFEKDSSIVREHSDWFVHTPSGSLAESKNCCMLDVTHPGAKQYVRELYHRLTWDWGYRYLKIDIVSEYMTAGVYHDPEAGALQNLREYFRLVREAAHPDTYILGCTCPIFETAEFVDGMRISVDIFERWESVIKAYNLIFKRYFMNRTLFISDPDCLMIRGAENEDGDCRRYCSRTVEEIHTFLVAMYAAGGSLFLSDKLPLMDDRQIDLYARLLPIGDRVGVPTDLLDSYIPGVIECGSSGGVRRVALINWGERERTFRILTNGRCLAWEHFTDEEFGIHDGTYETSLAPHCAQLVCLKNCGQ